LHVTQKLNGILMPSGPTALGRELPVITASRWTSAIGKRLRQYPPPCRHL